MFKVPLYFWNKSTGVRAAKADLHSVRYDYNTAQLSALAKVRELYAAAKTAEHHLQLYETGIIPEASQALQSTTANYRVGKTDVINLLDSNSLLLKYQLMEQEELATLNKTLSMIGELTGEEQWGMMKIGNWELECGNERTSPAERVAVVRNFPYGMA